MLTSKQIREFRSHPVYEELTRNLRAKGMILQQENKKPGLDQGDTEFVRGRLQELDDLLSLVDIMLAAVEQLEFEEEQKELVS